MVQLDVIYPQEINHGGWLSRLNILGGRGGSSTKDNASGKEVMKKIWRRKRTEKNLSKWGHTRLLAQ